MNTENIANIAPIFLTTKRVCEILAVSSTTLWRLRQKSAFPKGIKVSSTKTLFKYEEVKSWADSWANSLTNETQA